MGRERAVKIVVLMGGTSDERAVSLSSGCQVAAALREVGHQVVAFDTLEGVLSQGQEARIVEAGVGQAPRHDERPDLLSTGDIGVLTHDARVRGADLFFLTLHGGRGEDGTIQALLEWVGTPFTGSGMLGAALAMDKDVSKRLFRDAGVPTPDWMVGATDAEEVRERLGLPVIVKAVGGGSSLRLVLAHDVQELEGAMREAEGFDDLVLFEAYMKGREFTVGVLGDEALPVGEIIPEHEFFDYACKYEPGLAQEIFPADVPGETARWLQRLALQTHRLLRLRDFSRVDFIVDEQGEAWCLEANALPGMTANSLLPKAAKAAGISFPELCDRIARLAVTRQRGAG
jgi:D-alanine-D-alanine ligase